MNPKTSNPNIQARTELLEATEGQRKPEGLEALENANPSKNSVKSAEYIKLCNLQISFTTTFVHEIYCLFFN